MTIEGTIRFDYLDNEVLCNALNLLDSIEGAMFDDSIVRFENEVVYTKDDIERAYTILNHFFNYANKIERKKRNDD